MHHYTINKLAATGEEKTDFHVKLTELVLKRSKL